MAMYCTESQRETITKILGRQNFNLDCSKVISLLCFQTQENLETSSGNVLLTVALFIRFFFRLLKWNLLYIV